MSDEHWIEVRERDFVDFSKIIRFVLLTPSEYLVWKKPSSFFPGRPPRPILTERLETANSVLALVCSGETRFVLLTEKETSALKDKLPHPKK